MITTGNDEIYRVISSVHTHVEADVLFICS